MIVAVSPVKSNFEVSSFSAGGRSLAGHAAGEGSTFS